MEGLRRAQRKLNIARKPFARLFILTPGDPCKIKPQFK